SVCAICSGVSSRKTLSSHIRTPALAMRGAPPDRYRRSALNWSIFPSSSFLYRRFLTSAISIFPGSPAPCPAKTCHFSEADLMLQMFRKRTSASQPVLLLVSREAGTAESLEFYLGQQKFPPFQVLHVQPEAALGH